jgi:hypothetical protein
MTEFGKLDKDGNYTRVCTLSQAAMMKCPHCIMVPEHYRDDDTCKCNDPNEVVMKKWGYRWNKKAKVWK